MAPTGPEDGRKRLMADTPFFSVLIPTRNRAQLLKFALQTALEQDFENYEVVVSDNHSSDNTRQVYDQLANSQKNCRYVNPGRDLSMCEHWEYILQQARGDYILYLCDDDALAPNSLNILHRLISQHPLEVLVWQRAYYHHPDVPERHKRGELRYELGSGEVTRNSTRQMVADFYRFDSDVHAHLPKMLNCAVSRDLITRCYQRSDKFFLPPFPDYSAACHLLAQSQSCHMLDLPIYICGVSSVSNAGIQYNRKQKFEDYLSLFEDNLLQDVRYPMRYLIGPYFLATQLRFHKLYPDRFPGSVDYDAYFQTLFTELALFAKTETVGHELKSLRQYMYDHYKDNHPFQTLLRQHRLGSGKRWLRQLSRTFPHVQRWGKSGEKMFRNLATGLLGKKRDPNQVAHQAASSREASQLLAVDLHRLTPETFTILDKTRDVLTTDAA